MRMSKRIALTGATGFVGGRVLHGLLAAGHHVRALARDPKKLADQVPSADALTVIPGALDDRAALTDLVQDADVVVHCAGLTSARNARIFHDVNVTGTAKVVDAALEAAPAAHIILISSLAAREPHLSPYAASKRAAEDIVARLIPIKNWTILRPPAVYGPGDKATLPFFKMAAAGFCCVPGRKFAATQHLSLIHVDDIASAVIAAAGAVAPLGSVFELRDDCSEGYDWQALTQAAAIAVGKTPLRVSIPYPVMLCVGAFAALIAGTCGKEPTLTIGKVKEIFHCDWVVRQNRLSEYVDWSPKMSVEEGFRQTVQWYKKENWL